MAKAGGASRRRFRLLPTVLLTAAILGLPTAVYAWGRSSSSFTITRVTVQGTRIVSSTRALRLLRDDYVGDNLFRVTSKDVRQTLKPLPYVAAAVVDRDFPDTLRVRVIEYRPAAYLLSAGRWFVLADDGHVILQLGQGASGSPADSGAGTATADASGPSPDASTAASPESSGSAGSASGVATATPASAGPDPAKLAAGPPRAPFHLPSIWTDVVVREGQTLRDAKVCAALGVALALPPARREQVRAIRVSATTGLTLTMTEGLSVVWGSADRSLAKTLALGAVLARYRLDGQRPSFVDVSVPDRVLARPVLK